MVLEHKAPHAELQRDLGERGIVDVPFEQRGCRVRVHVDGTLQQLKVWPVHAPPSSHRSSRFMKSRLGLWHPHDNIRVSGVDGEAAEMCQRRYRAGFPAS
jgi:hypothetical protein